jgi:glycosyltransferase involved in cell wall biosynthesis
MSEPIISIILPVYNTERYLAECLDSLTQQTLSDIEIICIDDGSTDDSLSVLEGYARADARVVVISQENAGRSRARNNGLAVAKGEYVWFVDSDDYVALNACEKTVELGHRFQADIIVFGGKTFPTAEWADWSLDTKNIVYEKKSIQALFYENGSYPFAANKLYRRSIIEEHGLRFDEEHALGEDHIFQFFIFPYAKNIVYCSDLFYFYRQRPNDSLFDISEVNKVSSNRILKHYQIVERVIQEWHRRGLLKRYRVPLLEWSIFFLYNDVQHLRYLDRTEFVQRYRTLLEQYELLQEVDTLENHPKRLAQFLLFTDFIEQCKNKVTVLMTPGSTVSNSLRGYRSLANQFYQCCDLVILDNGMPTDILSALQHEVSQDVRAQIVNVANSDEYVAKTVRAGCGDWVLFATLDAQYRLDFLSILLNEPASDTAEILTAREFLGKLRTQSMVRLLKTKAGFVREGEEWNKTFAPGDFPDYLLSFSSLSAFNKLFKYSFLCEVLDKGLPIPENPYDVLGVGSALLAAHSICPFEEQLVETGQYLEIHHDEQVRQLARATFEGFAALKDLLAQSDRWLRFEKTYVNALQSTLLYHLDAVLAIDLKLIWAQSLKKAFGDLLDASRYDAGWYFETTDYEVTAELMATPEPKDLLCKRSEVLRQERDMRAMRLEEDIWKAKSELVEYLNSRTYKAGLLVTALPRKLRDWLAYRHERG